VHWFVIGLSMTREQLFVEFHRWTMEYFKRLHCNENWNEPYQNLMGYAERIADLDGDCEHDRLNDAEDSCLDCHRIYGENGWQ
jgi:hypothetical protein